MRKRMSFVYPAFCLTVILGFNALAFAGDINPPPGPVGPTMKTLVEIEPRVAVQSLPGSATALHVISEPGSYYLTGNITGVAGKHGLAIAADDVTVDLNGFALVGVPDSLSGINVSAVRVNVAIHGGTIRNWGGKGVDFSQVTNAVLRDLRIMNNGGMALHAGGSAVVEGCVATGNVDGIRVGDASRVAGSTANNNGNGNGIIAGLSSTITNCTARGNGDGIVAEKRSTIRGCTSSGNIAVGIRANDGCTVVGCTVSSNQVGIVAQKSVTISTCTATDNAGNGISAGNGSTITQCTAGFNRDNGIALENSGSITGCTVHGNHFDGIAVNSGVRVVGNTCDTNANVGTGAGIHATSDENLIQGNNLSNNRRGIWSVAGGNLIVKNNAIGNLSANYDLHAADVVGTITSNPTTANAWANLSN
jgi:Right handed beta helix region